ncbi:MAG: hypothetical protein AMS27_13270 [Bacteroides sp. SM23_62_1]|nr:MAG: hypothetical protein AMS27_13270 [Bacteroides sp. SM23_62_1]
MWKSPVNNWTFLLHSTVLLMPIGNRHNFHPQPIPIFTPTENRKNSTILSKIDKSSPFQGRGGRAGFLVSARKSVGFKHPLCPPELGISPCKQGEIERGY